MAVIWNIEELFSPWHRPTVSILPCVIDKPVWGLCAILLHLWTINQYISQGKIISFSWAAQLCTIAVCQTNLFQVFLVCQPMPQSWTKGFDTSFYFNDFLYVRLGFQPWTHISLLILNQQISQNNTERAISK